MVLARSYMSENNRFTSTTCAQSIDVGMPAIVIMKRVEGQRPTGYEDTSRYGKICKMTGYSTIDSFHVDI